MRGWGIGDSGMDITDIEQIADALIDIRDGICRGDGDATLHLHQNELHRIIQRLEGVTFMGKDEGCAVLLASLEHEARLCKQEIERRLGVRN